MSKNDWIPISEELPQEFSRVLLTVEGIKGAMVRSGIYYENGVFNSDTGEVWKVGEKGLKAWMPLIEPYKE